MFIFINFLLIFILFATPLFSSDFPEQPSILSFLSPANIWSNARTILFDKESNVSKDSAVIPKAAVVTTKFGKTLSKKEKKKLAAENARIEAEEIRQREIEHKAQKEKETKLSLSRADELLSLPTEKDDVALHTAVQQDIASSSNLVLRPTKQHIDQTETLGVAVKSKAESKSKKSRRQAQKKASTTEEVKEKKEEEKPKKYVPVPIADLSTIGQGRPVVTQKKTAIATQLLTEHPIFIIENTQSKVIVTEEKHASEVSGKPIDQPTASNSRQLSVDADIFVPRNAVLCFKQPSDTLSSSNESSTKGLSAPDLSAALAIDSTKLPFIQPKDEVDEALMQTEASIALLKGYLDTLEKENERHSIFAKIAKKRKKYTEKCEYLIQQAEFLLKEIDISLQDSLFQEAIKETENAKADFETKKAEFERYIQVLLNPDAHTNRAKPTDYFSTSMENIYLYNLFLENKIIILENILNSVDGYL